MPEERPFLPYGRQTIDEDDVRAVVEALQGDLLTTGPRVARFEEALATAVSAEHAVAVSSGTAALHAIARALELGPGDEVIVPPITFAATANAVAYEGALPVFADVEPERLLIDPAAVEARITARTKAVFAVDFAGHPCDYERLGAICRARGLALVSDGCHAIGGSWRGRPVGSIADLTAFSFHPVKTVTTGEGGAVTTASAEWAKAMRRFRNHGLSADHAERLAKETWRYDLVELGMNYRITDVQCALGLSQLAKLERFVARRRAIAALYDERFSGHASIRPLGKADHVEHGYHLYVVEVADADRAAVFRGMRQRGIGVNVHYVPVHLHSFYRERFGTGEGLCPNAEAAYERILSLPIFPTMTQGDVDRVVQALDESIAEARAG